MTPYYRAKLDARPRRRTVKNNKGHEGFTDRQRALDAGSTTTRKLNDAVVLS